MEERRDKHFRMLTSYQEEKLLVGEKHLYEGEGQAYEKAMVSYWNGRE